MAFIKFSVPTTKVGCDSELVYDVPDEHYLNSDGTLNESAASELGYEIGCNIAEEYGLFDEQEDDGCEPEEPFSYSYKKLDETREEIEENYGTIYTV